MSAMLKSCMASALLAVSFAALAADDADTDASTVQSSLGQMAVRDAATGQLRAPTAAEAKSLQAAGAVGARAKSQSTLTKYHHSGATGARLNDNFMSYSVVVKQADGKLVEFCFDSEEAAKAAMAAPVSTNNNLPTE